MTPRTTRTRQRILDTALRLFTERGFDSVTVNEIAATAGVSHMTVFRHFPTKEDMVVTDPFDPLMVEHILSQPAQWSAFERTRQGLISAWKTVADLPEADESLSSRLRLITSHPGLRARMWETNTSTIEAISSGLQQQGTAPVEAVAAAGACIGALTATLLQWGTAPQGKMGDTMLAALNSLKDGVSA